MDKRIKKADDLMRRGDSSLAVSLIKKIIKDAPDDPYLYYLLGVARLKCCRFFQAKKALERADQLLPHHADNLRGLGWVKVMLGDFEEGKYNLREAISLDLMNPLPYLDLAMSFLQEYNFSEGREWLVRASALAPTDKFIQDNVKTAETMERKFNRKSAKEKEMIRAEALDVEAQRQLRLLLLEKYYERKSLTKDEIQELKEEWRLNGVAAAISKKPKNWPKKW